MIRGVQREVRIGTSNIVLPGNKSTFPEAFRLKSRLNYYSSLFNTVELNSTFYKVPMASTLEKWSQDVGNDFLFSIKIWKGITHVKELQFDAADINMFIKKAVALENKKGCLLMQFPGKITIDYFNKVEEIFEVLARSEYLNSWRLVVEFRHPGWYSGETFELLDEFNASMVLHDFSKAKNEQLNNQAAVAYLRLHGPRGDYRGSYSDEYLQNKALLIKKWMNEGKEVFAYFNNTAGDALGNAKTLQKLVGSCY
jgi:uncharacterized protein YecE (DUF72 family)